MARVYEDDRGGTGMKRMAANSFWFDGQLYDMQFVDGPPYMLIYGECKVCHRIHEVTQSCLEAPE